MGAAGNGAIWRLTGPTPRRLMQDLPRPTAAPGTAWTGRPSGAGYVGDRADLRPVLAVKR
jgi:hypothetical protein